jgi:hypothetical protein
MASLEEFMTRAVDLTTAVGLLFLAATCGDSCFAQGRQVISVLETIGKSSVTREIIASVGEKSPALKNLAKQLGIISSDTARLVTAFDGLPASTRGAMILHDSTLGEAFLSSSRLQSDLTQHDSLVAAFNTLQTNKIGMDALPRWVTPSESPFLINPETRNVIATDTVKSLAVQPNAPAAGTLKLPSGEVVLREPFVICDTPSCKIQVDSFNVKDVIKDTRQAIIYGGPALCTLTTQCRDKVVDYAKEALDRINAGTSTSPPK